MIGGNGYDTGTDSGGAFGLTSHPTVWTYASVIFAAAIILALLRHFFGSIRVELGTK